MNNREYISTAGLSLEPLDSDPAPAAAKPPEKAAFHANTRAGTDRRTHGERREEIRFQDERRKKERRPKRDWQSGKNL